MVFLVEFGIELRRDAHASPEIIFRFGRGFHNIKIPTTCPSIFLAFSRCIAEIRSIYKVTVENSRSEFTFFSVDIVYRFYFEFGFNFFPWTEHAVTIGYIKWSSWIGRILLRICLKHFTGFFIIAG